MTDNPGESSPISRTLRYLLNLLRLTQHHLFRFFHYIAHCIFQSRPPKRRTQSIGSKLKPKPRPRALPALRPRALTAPPSFCSAGSSPPPTNYTQSQSPFFQLPFEIRHLIYRYALTSDVTHIVRLGPRLAYIRCRDLHLARPWSHRCWGITVKGGGPYQGVHEHFLGDEGTGNNDKRGLLPLVMACRRIYVEAIPVLYGDTTFSMRHLESLGFLADTILPQRLNTIRSVDLGCYFYVPYPLYGRQLQHVIHPPHDIATWERIWSILASMEGLMKLRVDLVGRWVEPLTAEEERLLLWPAMKVRRPRVWDMIIDWEDPGLDWAAQGAPFRAIREQRDWIESNAAETSIWHA